MPEAAAQVAPRGEDYSAFTAKTRALHRSAELASDAGDASDRYADRSIVCRVQRAKAHLDDCFALAGGRHKLYLSLDDSLRRTANRAFFEKLWVQPDADTIDGDPGQPFTVLFNRDIHALARTRPEGERRTRTGNVAGLNNELPVGPVGIEFPPR